MIIELGNHSRLNPVDDFPGVTYINLPDPYLDRDGFEHYTLDPGLTGAELRAEIGRAMSQPGARSGITSLPRHAALVHVVHPGGPWAAHTTGDDPKWVNVIPADGDRPESVAAAAEMSRVLSEYWDIPQGRPGMFDELYHRQFGTRSLPPGVLPAVAAVQSVEDMLTDVGRVIWANALGGGQLGSAGKGTAAAAGSFTTNKTLTTNQYAGYRVYVADTTNSQVVYGNIISNNNTGGASVLTIDQWYNAATPGGAAATAPAAGFEFIIADGGSLSAWFIGITTTNITPAHRDTSLSGEATANGMGRALATFTLTSGTSPAGYTISNTFTYGTSGTLTFYAMGAFVSNVKSDTTDTMVFETSFAGSFTVTTSGDQVTVTDAVAGS